MMYSYYRLQNMSKDKKPQDLTQPIDQAPNVGDIVLDSSGALCRISKVNTDLDMVCTAPLENARDLAHKINVDFKEASEYG